jgi:hypothetical protein
MVVQRLGIPQDAPIYNDFPIKSRIALAYIFNDLSKRVYIQEDQIIQELNRIGRFTSADFEGYEKKNFVNQVLVRLQKIRWYDVMNFCERVYEKFLHEIGWENDFSYVSLEEIRNYYSKEINQILIEDNLAFSFENGYFQRRGRAQTQKSIERVATVLSNPTLEQVKNHFNKALRFFSARPNPDNENCVKETLCALEASVEILSGKKASLDFDKAINQITGNDLRQIPPPIADSMKKIHSYRGSGQGVAHAALQGNRVLPVDAELVLSVVAAYITYLFDLFPLEDEIPF